MNNRRVAILRSNPVAPDPRVEKLARTLMESGRKVLIAGWDRSARQIAQEEIPAIGSVYRLRLKAAYGSGMRNLPFLFIWQMFLIRWLCTHRQDIDVVHACDFDTVLPALLVGKILGKKVVFEIFDMYSDSVRNTPAWILKMISWAERWAINSADAVILADESRKQQISGSDPKKLVVIFNSPEKTEVEIVQTAQRGSGFRLVYVGLLVKERSLSEVIDIVGRHPDWRLDLAGFGGDEQEIVRLAEKFKNISWHGRVAYQQALTLMSNADLLFAIYDPAVPNHRYSSPNKVFEAMLLEKPILVAHGTNMDKIITEHDCGLVLEFGNVGQLEEAIDRVSKDSALGQKIGKNGARAYKEHYSWEIMKGRIINLYSEL